MSKEEADKYIIPNDYVVNDYKILDLIHVGKFGGIYNVKEKSTGKTYVMKTESFDSRNLTVPVEIRVLKELKGSYFPKLHESGNSEKFQFNYAVMNCLGASLGQIQLYHNHKLQIEDVYNFGLKMLKIIRVLHLLGYVHQDIKPNNFLLQQNPKHPVVLIDFNSCKQFIDPNTNEPFPCKREHKFVGTLKYASINTIGSFSCGRNDDLLSWFYTFLDLACGSLPWEDEKDKDKAVEMRSTLKLSDLSYKLPKEFQELYDYLQKLNYDDKPDYDRIAELFEVGMKNDSCDPNKYDFTEFIRKHTNMFNFKEKIDANAIKYINDRKRKQMMKERRELEEQEKKNRNEEEDEDSDSKHKKMSLRKRIKNAFKPKVKKIYY